MRSYFAETVNIITPSKAKNAITPTKAAMTVPIGISTDATASDATKSGISTSATRRQTPPRISSDTVALLSDHARNTSPLSSVSMR
jgi:hypothetical protein